MRNALLLLILSATCLLFSATAEGKTIDRFSPSDGGLCRELVASKEIIAILGNKECIFGVDINSFSKFKKGVQLFGKIGKNTYSDNKNLYYLFTNDFIWKSVEMNVKKIKKLKNGYLSDGVSYFYFANGYPYPDIISFGKVSEGQLSYLDQDMVELNNKLYSKGRLLEGFSVNNIVSKEEFVLTESLYSPGGYMAFVEDTYGSRTNYKIDGVDKDTFKRTPREQINGLYTYEDRYNFYIPRLGPYNYYYMTQTK